MGTADVFREFLQRHGAAIHADLQLLVPLMGDRGVIAAKNISAGQQLMLIPTSICPHMPGEQEWSSHEPHHFSPAVQYLRQSCPHLSPFLATVLLMLHEQAQGRSSELWPFLETLPANHDCLLAWSLEEAAELKGTSIERKGSPAQSVFQREALPAMQAQPALWPPPVQGYAAFERMAGLVQSRTFHMLRQNWVTGAASEGAELHMLPGIDLINHSCMPAMRNTELNRVDEPLTVMAQIGKEVIVPSYFTMTAARDIARGEQLLHSYGNLSDAETLETYGFVENLPEGHRNPHNNVKVPLDLVIRTSEAAQITHQQPLSEALAETVQLLQETAEGLHGTEHEICDSDESVYHHLLSIADAMMARLPTSAEEDKLACENISGLPLRPAIELLKKHNEYCRLAMAYKVRMGERELIQGLRRATVMLMMGQQQQDDEASQGEEVDSDDNDSGNDISDSDYDTNISEASSEEEAAGNAAKRHRQ